MKNNYLVQAWLVLFLAIAFGAALAGMQIGVRDKIAANKLNETYDQIPKLVSGADKDSTEELATDDGKIAYKAIGKNGEHLGWVIKAVGQGFADRIELLIALDSGADRILGMYVLDQKETPALGNRIVEADWRAQFQGLDASRNIDVVKQDPAEGENQIQALTGATVSSESVSDIVNQAVEQFRNQKNKLEKKE